jgi:hypothetical protein
MHEVHIFGWGILSTPDIYTRWAMWREGRDVIIATPRHEIIVGGIGRRLPALHVSLCGWGFRIGRMEEGGWGFQLGRVAVTEPW